jgi:hypothetical protein
VLVLLSSPKFMPANQIKYTSMCLDTKTSHCCFLVTDRFLLEGFFVALFAYSLCVLCEGATGFGEWDEEITQKGTLMEMRPRIKFMD